MNMRVLLATDLSTSADIAARLVAGLRWPDGTTIHVLGVIAPAESDYHGPRAEAFPARLRAAAEQLVAPGRAIEAAVDNGHAADLIIDEATRLNVDLVVLGSRGRGPLTSAVLGSVSARVVDEAPCPVIVARRESISRVIFGDDGAVHTAEAAKVLTWPVLSGVPVHVVSVAEVQLRLHDAGEQIANDRAAALARLGIRATGEMRHGAPAAALIDVATRRGAGLIVVGSRRVRGFRRVLEGSTARELLFHAPCSVLIAPGTLAVETVRRPFASGWASTPAL